MINEDICLGCGITGCLDLTFEEEGSGEPDNATPPLVHGTRSRMHFSLSLYLILCYSKVSYIEDFFIGRQIRDFSLMLLINF